MIIYGKISLPELHLRCDTEYLVARYAFLVAFQSRKEAYIDISPRLPLQHNAHLTMLYDWQANSKKWLDTC